MARDISSSSRHALLELEDRLLDEGFQFLLSILPRELFQLCNDRIVLNEKHYGMHPESGRLIFAYVSTPEKDIPTLNAAVDAEALETPNFSTSGKRSNHVELAHLGNAELEGIRKIPPLFLFDALDSDYERSPACRDHTIALVKYFLLAWASENNCDVHSPQPNYEHLVAALARLMTTRYYKTREIIHEDEERIDVQMCLRKGEELHPRVHSVDGLGKPSVVYPDRNDTVAGHSARLNREPSRSFEKPTNSEQDQEVDAARLPTPHQTPKESMLDVSMVDSAEGSTRAASVASAGDPAPGAELPIVDSLDPDVVMTLESEALMRQSLPTPDTLMEEAIVDTDPTLRDIQKKLGHEALSLLPNLKACTFKKIHTDQAGFLSLRLLLGKFREDISRPGLEDSEAWASFKLHDKNDRAAPRMHVHAFRAGTDDVVEDDLKIKDVLPDLNLGPAFNSINGGDRAEELLLKALVKYYFIIAAKEKLLGFDKHKMPYNSSFVEQLKNACKRLQKDDLSRDDQRMQSRPFKRLKRSHDPTPRPSSSLSDADDDIPSVRTRDARRSGGRTGQPSSTAVSESEDNVSAFTPTARQRIPRRLALGIPIFPLIEGPAMNEFLDPDANPADSEGDSGDEIPAPISANVCDFLAKRHSFQRQMKFQSDSVKHYRNRKESTIMGIRKVKGMLNKNVMEPEDRREAERGLAHRRMCEETIKTHLAMKGKGLDGWKAMVKQINREATGIDPRVVEAWEVLHKV